MIIKGINDIFPDHDSVRYFSLARHALLAALRLLEIKQGQQILLPSFMCRELLAPINISGATPVYYDVDERLRPVSLPHHPAIRAVIVVNFFGIPQDLTIFHDFCSASGTVLIEDNAHGFLSRDENGLLLGCRGDLGIFSLRKTFPLPDGAALTINSKRLSRHLPVQLDCCQAPLGLNFKIKKIMRQFQNCSGIRIRTACEQLARIIRRIKTGHYLPVSCPEAEQHIPGLAPIHCESMNMLRLFDANLEVIRRRELYRQFHHLLAGMDLKPVFDTISDGTAPYGYAFRASNQVADTVAKIARKKGLECSSWPDLPDTVITGAPEYYKNVWWINFLC